VLTIVWHEIVAWALVLLSGALFLYQRKRSDERKYYMVLQGILRACHQRAAFLAGQQARLDADPQRPVPRNEHALLINACYTDNLALMEHIMGAMKAIEPGKAMPFELSELLRGGHVDAMAVQTRSALAPLSPAAVDALRRDRPAGIDG
jgi:hypothetical protein